MPKFVLKILLICLLSSFSHGEQSSFKNDFLNARILSVGYSDAVLEIELINMDGYHLQAIQSEWSDAFVTQLLMPGKNIYSVTIERGYNQPGAYTEESILLMLGSFNGGGQTSLNLDLPIHWPGKDYLPKSVEGEPQELTNIDSLTSVSLMRGVQNLEVIYSNMLQKGVPIEKINKFGMPLPTQYLSNSLPVKNINVEVGVDVDPNVVRAVTLSVLESSPNSISFKSNKYNNDQIGIKFGPAGDAKTINQEEILQLSSEGISDTDFFEIAGLKYKTQDEKVNELYEKAYSLIDRGGYEDIQQARIYITQILELKPDFPPAYIELARIYMKESQYGLTPDVLMQAENSILVAKDIDPNLADTRVLLGYVYTYQERYEEAHREFQLAEKLGADNLWLYSNWALNLNMQGRIRESESMYAKVIGYNRTFDRNDRPQHDAYWHLSELYIKEKTYDKADRLYIDYAKKYPDAVCVPVRHAEIKAYYLGDYENAIDLAVKGSERGCNDGNPVLGVAYYLKWMATEGDESISALRRAETLAPCNYCLILNLSTSDITAAVIPALEEHGMDINAKDDIGNTALSIMVNNGNIDGARRLLENGLDVNQSNLLGLTPLDLALFSLNFEMIKLILFYKFGFDIFT